VIKNFKDVPILSVSLQSTLWNKTGNWRYLRPSYITLQAPCANACPLHQDISFYLTALADGKPGEAWQKMLDANPFPSICGRVCHHPCEVDCNRKDYDEALAIHSLERFLGDWGMKKGKDRRRGDWGMKKGKDRRRKTERKNKAAVAVIGSGPAGLACAYFLAREGHPVKVFEAMPKPGGMLRYGIPAYRLPKKILDKEIDRIQSLGVEIQTQKKLGVNLSWEDVKSFAALFLATGAHGEQIPGIPGRDLQGSLAGLAFLKEINAGKKIPLAQKVVVIGGGNTAIDSARTARRQGCQVTVLYRRAKEDMPAIAEEVEEAGKEGVHFIFHAQPIGVQGKKGNVQAIECLKMRLADGRIAIDGWGRTNIPGIFAGGDAATGEGYVSLAIASGKRTAQAIIRYLCGEKADPGEEKPEVVRFEKINLDYFPGKVRVKSPVLDVANRAQGVQEVYGGLTGRRAKEEAGRCFSCGNCIRCNVCLMVCPDVAIAVKDQDNGYCIDYDHCKGCGICVVECPRSAMALEEEKWSK
ncbi:MAG: FAD-dependent oxidoreductase, partial [Deltaproteobacteria bacterium]|nr:FAD-dependent oxidoreductase [Deltaproteobacteria bacterium]